MKKCADCEMEHVIILGEIRKILGAEKAMVTELAGIVCEREAARKQDAAILDNLTARARVAETVLKKGNDPREQFKEPCACMLCKAADKPTRKARKARGKS